MRKQKQRTSYSAEFKSEALALAAKKSARTAANELDLKPSQLYAWRQAAERRQNTSQREMALNAEVAHLKRQLAEQAEELVIVKKRLGFNRSMQHRLVNRVDW